MYTDNTAFWFVYLAIVSMLIVLIKFVCNIVKEGWKAYRNYKNKKV